MIAALGFIGACAAMAAGVGLGALVSGVSSWLSDLGPGGGRPPYDRPSVHPENG